MVVAQLVEWSLPISEVHSWNPVIGKKIKLNIYCQLYWIDENKEKEAVNGPFKKQNNLGGGINPNLRWRGKQHREEYNKYLYTRYHLAVIW